MKIPAFHTNSQEYAPSHRNVYHDHSECRYGKEIMSEHRRPGEGDRPRCTRCIRCLIDELADRAPAASSTRT